MVKLWPREARIRVKFSTDTATPSIFGRKVSVNMMIFITTLPGRVFQRECELDP
jgi:hypothetical protein